MQVYLLRFVVLALVAGFATAFIMPSKNGDDCSRFRAGKFRLRSKIEPGLSWMIERHDSLQVETNEKTGLKTIVKIIWTAPCQYTLTLLSSPTPAKDSLTAAIRKQPLYTRIMSSTRDYYVFESVKDGLDFKYTDSLWVIRN